MENAKKVVHVRKGDTVKIIAGKDRGNTGKIVAVNLDNGRVVVDGRNIIIKHVKGKSAGATSSIQKVPGSIDSSNVQILCPGCAKPTRVAKKEIVSKDGKRKWQRTCKKCAANLDAKLAKVEKKVKKTKKDDDDAKVKDSKKVAAKGEEKEAKKKSAGGDGITTKNEDGAIV